MKKVDRKELLARLLLLRPAMRTGGMIPETSHVWFRPGRASAFDGASLGVSVDVGVDLECGLPGPVLLGLLGTSRLPDASLEADAAGTYVRVGMGKSRTKLAALDSERDVWPFPVDDDGAGDEIELSKDILVALDGVLVVDPKMVTRLEHQGVLLYREKGRVVMCATDSATMAMSRVDVKKGKSADLVMLPRNFAEQVARHGSPGDVLRVMEDYMSLSAGGVRVCTQVVDVQEAQDIAEIFEQAMAGHPDPVRVPGGLKIALERAVILNGEPAAEAVVDVEVGGGEVRVSGSLKYGDLSERMKLGGKHPDARGQFAAQMVRRGLSGRPMMSLDDQALVLRDERGGSLYAVAPRHVA